jgi:hypothetical protein
MSTQPDTLVSYLVSEGTAALTLPRTPAQFAYQPEADALINDIEHCPQAFVLGCLCNRQGSARQAWRVPHELLIRCDRLDVERLAKLSESDWLTAVREPFPIHRRPEVMAKVLRLAVDRLGRSTAGTLHGSGMDLRRAPRSYAGSWSSMAQGPKSRPSRPTSSFGSSTYRCRTFTPSTCRSTASSVAL